MTTRKSILLAGTALAVAATAIIAPSPAEAQQGAARLEEITVTARKQEESLQDIPLSIQAFTAREISRRGINELSDVAAYTAGLTFEDYASSALEAPVIRGLAQTRLSNPVQNVASFLDGIYLQRSYMIDIGFLDTQRIEVVKGPQSALYGRNAFAGAINYISQGPTEDWQAQAELNVGSDERFGVKGSVSGPIIEGILFGRVAYGIDEFDGTWENNHPQADNAPNPGTRGNVGGYDNEAYQFQLELRPIEGLELSGMFYETEINQESTATNYITGARGEALGFIDVNQLNCSPGSGVVFGFLPFGPGNQLLCGEFDAISEDQVVVDPRAYGQWGTNTVWRAEGTYEFAENWLVNFLYGRAESEITAAGQSNPDSINGTFAPPFGPGLVLFDSQPNGFLESDQFDFRLEYNDDRWRALAGYFYSETDDLYISTSFIEQPLGTNALLPDSGDIGAGNFRVDEVTAFYGLVSFDVTSDLTLGAEIRYTEEDKQLTGTFGGTVVTQQETFEYWTPRVTADWQVTDQTLLYASAAKGVKAGGFNDPFLGNGAPVDPTQESFDPEENWTYEIGAKNTFLDGNLVVNVAAYYVDWTELQDSEAPIGATAITAVVVGNVGGASSTGIEIDGVWSATENLSFNYAWTWNDPKFDDDTIWLQGAVNGYCDGSVCPADGDISENQLPRTSKWQGALGAEWQDTLTDAIDWYVRGDLTYQSEQPLTNANVGTIPSRTLVNTRLGLEAENWEVSVWTKNLFNEEYVASSLFLGFANAYVGSLGEQRTWGLTGKVRF